MKKLLIMTLVSLSLAGCYNDDENVGVCDKLVTAKSVFATIDSLTNYNGLLEIYPCIEGSTIYQGGYYNGKLMPFPAYYDVVDGIGQAMNNPLTVTPGIYDLYYWGFPNYSNYTQVDSYVTYPGISIGTDISNLYFSLTKLYNTSADTLYIPAYDMVLGRQTINISTQQLSASLSRVNAGMNVIVTNSDSTAFSTAIDSMWMYVGGISYQLNFASGLPSQGNYKTVTKGMSPSSGRTYFSSDTLYVFPSAPAPPFQLFVQLSSGTVKSFKTYISKQLNAGSFTTLFIKLNGILLSKNSTGTFTIDTWSEQNDSITFPVL